MNKKKVDWNTFNTLINKIGAVQTGEDVGRTHGIFVWSRNGKWVATSYWNIEEGIRTFSYEIADYLYQAYFTG